MLVLVTTYSIGMYGSDSIIHQLQYQFKECRYIKVQNFTVSENMDYIIKCSYALYQSWKLQGKYYICNKCIIVKNMKF
jgi:hypothetical protein